MIKKDLSFSLPLPWTDKTFATPEIGSINFLVGPNGSGKSKFAAALRSHLSDARLLGTDRLSGMEQTDALGSIYGERFASGMAKGHFQHLKNAGRLGSGIDTIVLLEERVDLRIQVEATLSHIFDRKIILEWDSGNLVANAVLGRGGHTYRLDRDECHGIKELLILLTHLYNGEHPYLIIDEPELHLHPQYQAFFMQEVRKLAGDPVVDPTKKTVFLVTHSPFILDLRSVDDVKSIISFGLDHLVPKQILNVDAATTARLASLVPRLNVHHKQLFFSDNPIFVEGIFDAQIVGALQEARGVSIAGAGSCIIDAGGNEEVNRYLELCAAFGKKAHFLYDLDSLFGGNLRACVKDDGSVQSFLAAAGVGGSFGTYCGQLDRILTDAIDRLLSAADAPGSMLPLIEFLKELGPRRDWDGKSLARARVSVLTAMSTQRTEMCATVTEGTVSDIEGRLRQIVEALRQKRVILLPGGALERYLPAFPGDLYRRTDDAKRQAVAGELAELSKPWSVGELTARYGQLYEAVCGLPGKVDVDVGPVLRVYLSRYVFELQAGAAGNPAWQLAEVRAHLDAVQQASAKVFSIREFTRGVKPNEFTATIEVTAMFGQKRRILRVSQLTNAALDDFNIDQPD